MLQSVSAVGTLITAVYTDSVECGKTNIVNFVIGAEHIGDNCIEQLLQFHRQYMTTLWATHRQLVDKCRSVHNR